MRNNKSCTVTGRPAGALFFLALCVISVSAQEPSNTETSEARPTVSSNNRGDRWGRKIIRVGTEISRAGTLVQKVGGAVIEVYGQPGQERTTPQYGGMTKVLVPASRNIAAYGNGYPRATQSSSQRLINTQTNRSGIMSTTRVLQPSRTYNQPFSGNSRVRLIPSRASRIILRPNQ